MSHTPRVYVRSNLGPGPLALRAEAAKHLTGVLRLKAGEELLVFSGDGREWRATVSSLSRDSVLAEAHELVRQESPLPVVLEAWIGVVRASRLDDAIDMCVQAGADIIRPVLCEYSQRGESASQAKLERWRRIAIEAAEQSGRLFVPVVEPPVPLGTAIEGFRGAVVLGDPTGRPASELAPLLPQIGHAAWVVGPEGGLSEAESALLMRRGALTLSLGPYILRTETAATVGTAVLRALTM